MYYIIIDCGTTNSRAYVVDAVGTVLGLAKKTVGVKDTSVTGSRDTASAAAWREIIARAIELAGLQPVADRRRALQRDDHLRDRSA